MSPLCPTKSNGCRNDTGDMSSHWLSLHLLTTLNFKIKSYLWGLYPTWYTNLLTSVLLELFLLWYHSGLLVSIYPCAISPSQYLQLAGTTDSVSPGYWTTVVGGWLLHSLSHSQGLLQHRASTLESVHSEHITH